MQDSTSLLCPAHSFQPKRINASDHLSSLTLRVSPKSRLGTRPIPSLSTTFTRTSEYCATRRASAELSLQALSPPDTSFARRVVCKYAVQPIDRRLRPRGEPLDERLDFRAGHRVAHVEL